MHPSIVKLVEGSDEEVELRSTLNGTNAMLWCSAKAGGGDSTGWICDREPGHTGVHIAHRPRDMRPTYGYWVRELDE